MKAPLWMALAALCLPPVPLAAQSSPTRVVECGTDSPQRVLCGAGGRVASARLVRDLSSNRCSGAGSWGWTDNAVWADNSCRGQFEVRYATADSAATRRIMCGTLLRRRDECSTEGVADSVRLVRRSTFARCTEGSNWGYSDSLVWAGNGCRAEFEVVYRRAAPSPPPEPAKPVTRRITCGSYEGPQVSCRTEGRATDVRLARDFTGTRCREGANWGHTDTLIWTRQGCRGEFEVTYGDAGAAPAPGARRLTCGSATAVQMQCDVGGEAREVRVVRNLGSSECRRGGNWTYAGTVITAGRGCRGEFEVTLRGDTAVQMKPVTPAPVAKVISCGDVRGSAMSCNAFGTVATVRLQRDRSGGRCDQPSSWGLDDQSVWVARGCYGDFELTYTSAPK